MYCGTGPEAEFAHSMFTYPPHINLLRSPVEMFEAKALRHDIVSSSESAAVPTVRDPAGGCPPFASSSSSSFDSPSCSSIAGGDVIADSSPSMPADNPRARPMPPPSSPTVRSSTDILTPRMELANEAIWANFHRLTNEMVVCRTGRKMFPKIELKLSGLNAGMNYFIVLSMRLVDTNRYKFQAGAWSTAGNDNVPEQSNVITHHEGLNGSGEFWMRNVITFDRVKLTNKPKGEGSMIALSSMHKYQPVLQLYSCTSDTPLFVLAPPVLQFIAVTAYQNEAITQLKIAYNPFAKGFREGSARKRSYSPTAEDTSNLSLVSPSTKRGDSQFPPFNAAAFLPLPLAAVSNFHFNQFPSQAMFNFNNPHVIGANNTNSNIGNGRHIPANSNAMFGPKSAAMVNNNNNGGYMQQMFGGLSYAGGYNSLLSGHLPAYLTSSFASQAAANGPSAAMLATMLAAGQSNFHHQQHGQHQLPLVVSRGSSDRSTGDETSASPSTDNDNSLTAILSPTVERELDK